MRIGVLTGGGDCPGLNAVLRAVARKGERVYGDEIVGFLDAWDGVMERRTVPLTVEMMRGYLPRGGTTSLDLGGHSGAFSVRWYDPRNGGTLQLGSVPSIEGPGLQALGKPPDNLERDWAILVQRAR